jgi:hypothetical protein
MVDIPNIRAGWRYSIFGSTSVDHVTLRWGGHPISWKYVCCTAVIWTIRIWRSTVSRIQRVLGSIRSRSKRYSPESFTKAIKTTSKCLTRSYLVLYYMQLSTAFTEDWVRYQTLVSLAVWRAVGGTEPRNIVTEHVMTLRYYLYSVTIPK